MQRLSCVSCHQHTTWYWWKSDKNSTWKTNNTGRKKRWNEKHTKLILSFSVHQCSSVINHRQQVDQDLAKVNEWQTKNQTIQSRNTKITNCILNTADITRQHKHLFSQPNIQPMWHFLIENIKISTNLNQLQQHSTNKQKIQTQTTITKKHFNSHSTKNETKRCQPPKTSHTKNKHHQSSNITTNHLIQNQEPYIKTIKQQISKRDDSVHLLQTS